MQLLADIFLNTESWAFLLLLLWLWAVVRKKRRLKIAAIVLLVLWVLVVGVSPLPYIWAENLENKYPTLPTAEVPEKPCIVILGSGKSSDPDVSAFDQLYSTQLFRLVEGYRLYSHADEARVVLSGNEGSSRIPQAEVVAKAALLLGISATDTILLTKSFDTESEARYLRDRFPELSEIVLVTSALHMQRAVYWFETFGFHVIPAPTDHQVKVDPDSPSSFWGWNTQKISLTNKLLHEYAGYCEAKYLKNNNE